MVGVDFVFINFLEHLESGIHVTDLLRRVKELLRSGGELIVLQPNSRLLRGFYFDFIDHNSIFTHKNLEEALAVADFNIARKINRFCPI
jgi:hypothetical protein